MEERARPTRRAQAARATSGRPGVRLRRDRLTMAALVLLGVIVVLTLAGPWVAQTVFGLDPYRQTLPRRYQPPSPTNPFGTDDLGRDVLARTLIAGRVSLTIGVTSRSSRW